MSFVLNQEYDTCAIIGSRDRKEFDSCLEALKIKLTKEEMDYLCLKSDTYKG